MGDTHGHPVAGERTVTEARREWERRYMRIGDGSTWPDPADPTEAADRLARGNPTTADLRLAAMVMSAYNHLIFHPAMTQKERNRRCKLLREASDARRVDVPTGGEQA